MTDAVKQKVISVQQPWLQPTDLYWTQMNMQSKRQLDVNLQCTAPYVDPKLMSNTLRTLYMFCIDFGVTGNEEVWNSVIPTIHQMSLNKATLITRYHNAIHYELMSAWRRPMKYPYLKI